MSFFIKDFNSLIQHTKTVTGKKVDSAAIEFSRSLETPDDVFQKTNNLKNLVIDHLPEKDKAAEKIEVTQNPLDKAIIYKKVKNKDTGAIERIPTEVAVAKSCKKWQITYHFLDKNTQEEIGFVTIDDWRYAKDERIFQYYIENSKLMDNFEEEGIVGDRISIDFLQNNKEGLYSGIGKAADQIAIEYCLKEGITPNIISIADLNSHAAHYKRGRRFFKISKFDTHVDYYEFKKMYGTDDPNKIIEERIKSTLKGQKVDTEDLVGLYMYMPQAIIEKYLEKIKEKPILH